ncbi:MAG: hypothetical protein ACREJX_13685 [Polyangiaceae bacterium]
MPLLASLLGTLLLAQAPFAGPVLVVPFSDVSAVSGNMPSPTTYLAEQLRRNHVDVVLSDRIDPIVAATGAPQLCAERRVNGLIVGRLVLTRSSKFELPVGVASVFFHNASPAVTTAVGVATGLISVSGLLSRTAIRAEVHLYYVDCTGKLRAKETRVRGETHHGTNIGSGYTQIVESAVDEAVEALVQSAGGGT